MAERYPSVPESPNAALAMQLRRLEQDFRDVRSNLLRAAGLQAEPDLLRVLGSLVVAGSQEITGTLNVSGDAVFDGDLAVPNGSITNDALASPVAGGYGNASYGSPASPQPISTTETSYASATIAVPAGFSQAYVMAASSLAAQSASLILLKTRIDASDGGVMNVIADASGYANGSSNHAAGLSSLSGSFTVTSRLQAGIGGVTGMVTTSALAFFLR